MNPGANRVDELLSASQDGSIRTFINEINLGEIYYITTRKLGIESAKEFLEHFHDLPVEIVSASRDIIASASKVKAGYALSYADCFVVARALKYDASVVTGNPEFKNVEHIVAIDWICKEVHI